MPTETEEITITKEDTDPDLDVPWNVLVFDDPVNLMGFVCLVFQRVFGYDKEKSQELMLEVHQLGRSIVWSGNREQAEMYVQQLQGYQLRTSLEKAF